MNSYSLGEKTLHLMFEVIIFEKNKGRNIMCSKFLLSSRHHH